MGVDLYLLPVDGELGAADWFSHTLLSCERRRELWDAISAMPSREVPEEFSSFLGRVPDGSMEGEHGYGNTQEDPYGDRLRYTTAKDLVTLAQHEWVTDNPKNRAIWAYLAAAPPKMKVCLYWH